MLRWLLKYWHAHQRQLDVSILWPAIRNHVSSIELAREAFYMHTCLDPAWLDLSLEERVAIIEGLK